MEEQMSEEQMGFRKQYGTADNIHIVRQVIEKSREYKLPLFLCAVDLAKAFDSVEHCSIWTSLEEIGAHPQLVKVLQNIYTSAVSTIEVNGTKIEVDIKRGVRQGDVISPRLFTLVLDLALRKVDWSSAGLRVNGQRLTHTMFADDCLLFAPNKKTLRRMMAEFSDACSEVGLTINPKKSEYLNNQNDHTALKFRGSQLHPRSEVKYLGVTLSVDGDWSNEMKRRISSGWAGFNAYRSILKAKSFPMSMKRKIFNSVILPRLLYGCESWAVSKSSMNQLRVVQRKMERAMLNVHLQDRLSSTVIRGITRLKDVAEEAASLKFNFAYRLAHMSSERWSLVVSEWRPFNRKRVRGRPSVRWRDDLVEAVRSYNRTVRRGRVRPPNVRGEEIFRVCRDKHIWRAVKEHHFETI